MSVERCGNCMAVDVGQGVCPHCGYDNSARNGEHQLPAGTVLNGQYIVGRVLGQGGFGITYKGWDSFLEIPVAIKEYFPTSCVNRTCTQSHVVKSYGGDTEARFEHNKKRFQKEVRALAKFTDVKEIVQVRNFFYANNTAYIVMEYVDGMDIRDYMVKRGGCLTMEETKRLLEPIVNAVARVHKEGLVHRDISPDNIMLLPDGTVKLLDFGAVRDLGTDAGGASTSTEAIIKHGFAPIEQYVSGGEIGTWTDVYALCATMYYCVTGKVPTDAASRVLDKPILWFSELGLEVEPKDEEALRHGMALKHEDRLRDMGQLRDELYGDEAEAGDEWQRLKQERERLERWQQSLQQTETQRKAEVAELSSESEGEDRAEGQAEAERPREPQPGLKDEPAGGEKKERPKMTKWLIAAAVLVAAAVIVIIAATAGSGNAGAAARAAARDYKYTAYSSFVYISKYTGSETEVVIPEKIEGKPVTYISGSTFENCSTLTSVVIPEGVTDIGSGAFRGCSALTSVVIPEGVTDIGSGVFEGCSALTGVVIPAGVTNIGSSAFKGCSALTGVVIPAGVKMIGKYAFEGCSALTGVVIPKGVKSLESGAFKDCSALTYIEIPGGVAIGPEVVSGCDKLSAVFCADTEYASQYYTARFPAEVRINPDTLSKTEAEELGYGYSIGENGITISDYTGSATWLPVPREIGGVPVTAIGDSAFSDCASLTGISIPEGISSIGDAAFRRCASLTGVSIPEGVTSIGSGAFRDCGSLTDVSIPESVTEIKDSAFYGCGSLTEVAVPNSATELGTHIFADCGALKKATLPEGLTAISERMFSGCVSLTDIAIPESVTKIGTYAFYDCGSLAGVTLPLGVTAIEGSAFRGCAALTDIELPAGVTTIGERAFASCDALTSITVPASVSSVGASAFSDCKEFSTVNYFGTEEQWAVISGGFPEELWVVYK